MRARLTCLLILAGSWVTVAAVIYFGVLLLQKLFGT